MTTRLLSLSLVLKCPDRWHDDLVSLATHLSILDIPKVAGSVSAHVFSFGDCQVHGAEIITILSRFGIG